jgi:hypothetical protein
VADEEIPVKEESLNPRSIGWIIKRLRFKHANIGHKKLRGWQVTHAEVERLKLAFGLFEPEDTPAPPKTTPKTPETPADQKGGMYEGEEAPPQMLETIEGETEDRRPETGDRPEEAWAEFEGDTEIEETYNYDETETYEL